MRMANHGAKHCKIEFFCMTSITLTKSGDGGVGCFIYSKTYKYVSRKLKHKLQAAVPVFYWYFFNLNKIAVVKKEKLFYF